MEPYEQKTPGDQGNGIMRTEAGAPSPIWLEQAAAEELAGVCMEILGNARNELYLSMRFLDGLKLSVLCPGSIGPGTGDRRHHPVFPDGVPGGHV